MNKRYWIALIAMSVASLAHGQSTDTPSASASDNSAVGGGFETLTREQIHDFVQTIQRDGFVPDSLIDAVYQNVTTRDQIAKLKEQTDELENSKPELEKQQQAAANSTAALQKQLADLNHTDASTLATLKSQVADPNGKLVDKLAAAHQFVWAFPQSTLLPDGQAILTDLIKQDADEKQRLADEARKRQERSDFLKKGAAEHNLLLQDWREFLRNMTQDDVLLYLGPPSKKGVDGSWYYSGSYTIDPANQQRTGLVLFFNGTRVLNISVSAD